MGRSRFDRCDFTGADLRSADLAESDLRGSIFRDANLEAADLQKCDLRGCDLRGAKLDRVLFNNAVVDATTDLRGASLLGLYNEEIRGNAGQLVAPFTDWRGATWDETTRHGAAPGAEDKVLLDAIIRAAKNEPARWAAQLADEAKRIKKNLAAYAPLTWMEPLLAAVAPGDRAAAEAFVARATLDGGG
jgi:uncharacterized protein YjbI with pentapeptide repeats